MFREIQKIRCRSGTSLTEVMITIVILTIVIIGASGYRYCSSLNARWAQEQITAARLGQFLCGGWAGVKGDETYDLTASLGSDLTVETLAPVKSPPSTFVLLGEYEITLEGITYDCVLAWKNVTPELRAILVSVEWDCRETDTSYTDQALRKSFLIITYV